MTLDTFQMNRILIKLTYIGLLMNVVVPIGAFATFLVTTGQKLEFSRGFGGMERDIQILFYALLVVSAIDLIATIVVRRVIPDAVLRSEGKTVDERFEKAAVNLSFLIFSINLSYAVFGFILFILGAPAEVFMLFIALCLVAYQLFRLRPAYLERLYEKIKAEGISH